MAICHAVLVSEVLLPLFGVHGSKKAPNRERVVWQSYRLQMSENRSDEEAINSALQRLSTDALEHTQGFLAANYVGRMPKEGQIPTKGTHQVLKATDPLVGSFSELIQ